MRNLQANIQRNYISFFFLSIEMKTYNVFLANMLYNRMQLQSGLIKNDEIINLKHPTI